MSYKINAGEPLESVKVFIDDYAYVFRKLEFYKDVFADFYSLVGDTQKDDFIINSFSYLTQNHMKNTVYSSVILYETLLLFILAFYTLYRQF